MAAITATTLLVAGCGSSTSPQAESDDAVDEPYAGDAAASIVRSLLGFANFEEVSDFEAFRLSISEPIVQQCMNDRGFDYIRLAPENYVSPPAGASLPPDEYARTFGFGYSTDRTPPAPAADPNDEIVQGLSDEAELAYLDARGSCLQLAGEQTAEVLILPTQILDSIDDLQTRVDLDTEVLAAVAGYVECMASRGIETVSPLASRQLVQDRLEETTDPSSVVSFELQVATADFECGETYRTVADQARDRIIDEYLDVNRSAIDDHILAAQEQ